MKFARVASAGEVSARCRPQNGDGQERVDLPPLLGENVLGPVMEGDVSSSESDSSSSISRGAPVGGNNDSGRLLPGRSQSSELEARLARSNVLMLKL